MKELLDQYFHAEAKIGDAFNTEIHDTVYDLREYVWLDGPESASVYFIQGGEQHQREIWGTSRFDTSEFVMFTVNADYGGGRENLIFRADKEKSDEEFDKILEEG